MSQQCLNKLVMKEQASAPKCFSVSRKVLAIGALQQTLLCPGFLKRSETQ